MNRFAYKQLLNWKKCSNSNLLILGGVSSVGKTALVKDFIEREFNSNIYIDISNNIFSEYKTDIDRLEEYSVVVIDNVFGDRKLLKEVYDLSKLKDRINFIFIDPFVKEGKGYHSIISARYLVLKPLTFEEFLFNVNRKLFVTLSKTSVANITEELNHSIMNIFSDYLYVGGMPSVVIKYIEVGITQAIRNEQRRILDYTLKGLKAYYKTTYFKNLNAIIETLYNSIIRDNQKFKLSDISESRRFSSFKAYFEALENLNLIHRSYCIKGHNVKRNEKSFIPYFFDSGLLGLIGDVPYELYEANKLFNNPITLGLCHNFVACEIFGDKSIDIYHWSHNMSKIEFVIDKEGSLLPIEIKNDISGKLKSFDIFNNYFKNVEDVRLNLSAPNKKGAVNTYPIYLINNLVRKSIS